MNLDPSICIVVVIFLLITFLIFMYDYPLIYYKLFTFMACKVFGLSRKSVIIDNYKIYYYEGGEGETVVLLHGFPGDKDNWILFSIKLIKKFHLVIPDQPGLGESSRIDGDKYGISQQVPRLHRFFSELGLENFHIAGNSTGGAIAGVYAAVYPDKILSLCLMDSYGVEVVEEDKNETFCSIDRKKLERLTELEILLLDNKNPFLISERKECDRFYRLVFWKKPCLFFFGKAYFAQQLVKNRDDYKDIFEDIKKDRDILTPHLNKINARTLNIWGLNDRFFNLACFKVIKETLKTSSTNVVIDYCGHSPMIEKPWVTAKIYKKFLSNEQVKEKCK